VTPRTYLCLGGPLNGTSVDVEATADRLGFPMTEAFVRQAAGEFWAESEYVVNPWTGALEVCGRFLVAYYERSGDVLLFIGMDKEAA
jgi:hypothetical protein